MREDWKVVPFGDVCEISGGSQPPKNNFIYEPRDGYIRLVQVRDYRTDKYLTYIPKEKAKKFCTKLDIMIGRYGPPIFGIFSGIEGAYNVALMKAIPNEEKLDKEFLRWFLKTHELVRFIEKTSKRAAGQDGVRKDRLYAYPTPIPLLSEQKQIVAILDQAFTAIDQAKANIEKNIVNAKELFQSKLNEIFSQKGDGWEEKTLGEVCDLFQGLAINAKTKHLLTDKSSLPLLRIKDLKNNTEEQFVSETNYPKNAKVNIGDIIYTRTGSLGLVFRNRKGILHNNSFKVIPILELSNNYLFWWLQHDAFTKIIFGLASRAAQPDITHKLFKQQYISIPSLKKQAEYYSEIEALDKLLNNVISCYNKKLIDLDDLKKSILQKAFSGELTQKEVVV